MDAYFCMYEFEDELGWIGDNGFACVCHSLRFAAAFSNQLAVFWYLIA